MELYVAILSLHVLPPQISANIQITGALTAPVKLAPALWLRHLVCELQTKIWLSQGRHNAGKLKGSSYSPSVALILNHWERKKSPHIRTGGSFDKMTFCSSKHSSFPFPRCIELPQPPSKWLAPPGACRAWHPSSAVTLRRRWRSDCASITAAI